MAAETEDERQRKRVRRAIERGSFCVLATSSAANLPHVVGVVYVEVEGLVYVSTLRTSVKARNVLANGRVAICVPVRRFPLGPPFHVAFQGRAELCPPDDSRIARLLEQTRLRPITSHGELEHPDSVFLIITPGRTASSYGVGVPLRELLSDPLGGTRSVGLA
jgi:hypothetical protein